jgi:Glycine-zipper domain
MMRPLKPGQRSVASFRSYIGPLPLLVLATALLVPYAAVGAQAGQLYIYPAKGQSQAQQDKDRYECHSWAVSQTGFDPSNPRTHASNAARASQYRPSQPHVARGAGRGAALGAVGGAIAGNAGKGAAAGAAMGGLAGGFRRRDERRQQATASTENQAATTSARDAYNRAFAACLKGRGYTVN